MDWIQLIASLVVILGGVWAMLKFLLRDTHKELKDLEREQADFRNDMKEMNKRFHRQWTETNARLDGLYKVILDRTYGTK